MRQIIPNRRSGTLVPRSSPPESNRDSATQESHPNVRQGWLELPVDEQGQGEQPERRHPQPHRPTLDRGRLTPTNGGGRAAPEADQGVVDDLGLTVGAAHDAQGPVKKGFA